MLTLLLQEIWQPSNQIMAALKCMAFKKFEKKKYKKEDKNHGKLGGVILLLPTLLVLTQSFSKSTPLPTHNGKLS